MWRGEIERAKRENKVEKGIKRRLPGLTWLEFVTSLQKSGIPESASNTTSSTNPQIERAARYREVQDPPPPQRCGF